MKIVCKWAYYTDFNIKVWKKMLWKAQNKVLKITVLRKAILTCILHAIFEWQDILKGNISKALQRRLKARKKPHTDNETEIASDAVCISSVYSHRDPGLSFCKLTGTWKSRSAKTWNYHKVFATFQISFIIITTCRFGGVCDFVFFFLLRETTERLNKFSFA